jgi:hypothetical protein
VLDALLSVAALKRSEDLASDELAAAKILLVDKGPFYHNSATDEDKRQDKSHDQQ